MSRRTAWGLDTPRGGHWTSRAACRGADTELFFGRASGSAQDATVKAAKRICANCSVRAQCLRDALQRAEQYGIWGGLTVRERRALRRRVTPSPAPALEDEALYAALNAARRARGLTWRQVPELLGIGWHPLQALRVGRGSARTRERVRTWLGNNQGAA